MSSDVELIKNKKTIKYIIPDHKNPGEFKSSIIPISRLNSIEIYGNLKISTPLLKLCQEIGIPCYINTYYGKPIGQFIPETSKSGIIRLKQYEAYLDENRKITIAKAIVIKATDERIRIIKKFLKKGKSSVSKEISKISQYKKRIFSVKNVSQLRGIEGNIMKIYFKILSNLLNHLSFYGRTQRPPKDEGNALMSYGNVLLYNTVHSEIYRSSLDPLIGYLHEPHENRNSLALDLAEIFRPIVVDNLILRLDHQRNLLPIHFNKDDIKCFLNIKGKKIWIKNFKNFLNSSIHYPSLRRNISVREEIKLECYNLIKYITGKKQDYSPLKFKNI